MSLYHLTDENDAIQSDLKLNVPSLKIKNVANGTAQNAALLLTANNSVSGSSTLYSGIEKTADGVVSICVTDGVTQQHYNFKPGYANDTSRLQAPLSKTANAIFMNFSSELLESASSVSMITRIGDVLDFDVVNEFIGNGTGVPSISIDFAYPTYDPTGKALIEVPFVNVNDVVATVQVIFENSGGTGGLTTSFKMAATPGTKSAYALLGNVSVGGHYYIHVHGKAKIR